MNKRIKTTNSRKRLFSTMFLCINLLFLFTINNYAKAEIPNKNIYQGQLFDSNNQPIIGEHVIRFSLWNSADFKNTDIDGNGAINGVASTYGGWNEAQNFTPSFLGNFSIRVGATVPLPEIVSSSHRFMQIEIKKSGDPDTAYELLDPTGDNGADNNDRQEIGSVFYAKDADIATKARGLREFNNITNYGVGDIIIKDGQFLRAVSAVSAGNFNATQWVSLGSGFFRGKFSPSTEYKTEEIVWGVNNKFYRVITDFTSETGAAISDSSVQLNLEAIGGGNGDFTYNGAQIYSLGDIISRGGELLRNIVITNGSPTTPEAFDRSKWENFRENKHSIVADEVALLALEGVRVNDTVYQSDTGKYYRHNSGTLGNLTDWTLIFSRATQSEAESLISNLNDDGSEISVGSVNNSSLFTSLRGLQQLLKNRLTSLFVLRDDADQTKKINFNASNISAGNTRTITVPDENVELITKERALVADYDPSKTYFKGQQIFHGKKLYRAKNDIISPESFAISNWEQINHQPWKRISSSQTLLSEERYAVNTSVEPFTLSLPVNPSEGDEIWITDGADFSQKNLTLSRNGKTILGKAENLILDVKGPTIRLYFLNNDWKIDFSAYKSSN